jgi:hypothetical protein
MNLQERRTEVETRIAELARARGAAKLDNVAFSQQAELDALREELDSLTAAEGLAADRARDAEEVRRLARLQALKSELAQLEQVRLDAIEQAHASALNLVDAFNNAVLVSERMAKVMYLISGGNTPMPLLKSEVENRLSNRLGGTLSKLKGVGKGRFGYLAWLGTGLFKHDDDWRDKEERVLRHHLEPLLGGEHVKGNNTDASNATDAGRRAAERAAEENSHHPH